MNNFNPKFAKKTDDVGIILSFSNKNSDFPNYNDEIELKFGLAVDLGPDFNFFLRKWIKTSSFDKKTHHSIVFAQVQSQ